MVSKFGAILSAMLCIGCASTAKEPNATTTVKETVVVVRAESFRFDWYKDIEPVKADLERCAAEAITDNFDDLRYLPRDDFARVVFPNLPTEAAPLSLKSMRVLIEDPVFRGRLHRLNLRYIIYVGGHTEIEAEHAWVGIGGYMAATVAGMSSWEKDTDVTAVVLDLKSPSLASQVQSHSEGSSWVAGVFPFIAGIPADTEAQACRHIASRIAQLIAEAKTLEAQI